MNSQAEVDQWEALDLGDSELPSFLRPCKRKSPTRSLQPHAQQQNPKAGFNSNTNHRPTLRRCSSPDKFLEESYSRSLIPGPAGVVQVAIRRKMNKDPKSFNEHGEPIPTQEFLRKAAEEPDWEDKDFSEDPWVSTVDYIRSEGRPFLLEFYIVKSLGVVVYHFQFLFGRFVEQWWKCYRDTSERD